MPGIALHAFPASSQFIFITALSSGYFYSHFMEEKTEAQEVEVTCSRTWASKDEVKILTQAFISLYGLACEIGWS